jgi:flagellar hook-length control protein FliK
VIEATSSAPTSSTDGPAKGGKGQGAAATDPTGALFAMLLAGIVTPTPAVQTPVPTGGKGAAAETGEEGKGVAALAAASTGQVATAASDLAALGTAPLATAAQAPQTPAAAPAAATEVKNGLPLTPDLIGKATGNPAPVVEPAKGKATLAPATPGKTGEATGPRAGRGKRGADAQAASTDTSAPATTTPTAAAPTTAPAATPTADASPTSTQGDASGQQQQTQQQPRQETPQGTDVRVDAAANITSTAPTTAHLHVHHAPAATPAPDAAATTQQTHVVPFTQDPARFEHLVEGLSARLHLSRNEGGSALRMTLRPEELGQVTVRLQVGADGATTATVTADSQQAASLLADAADDLRKALSDRGLQLDKLDVNSGGSSTLGDARPDSQQQSGQTTRDGHAPRSFYSFRAETEAAVTASTVDAREGETGHSYLA